MGTGRYNSFEDTQHDVQFSDLERRIRNLETLVGASGSGLHTQLDRLEGSSSSYTLGTYVDVTGLQIEFEKRSASTLLRVRLDVSGFVNVAGTRVDCGADIISTGVSYLDENISYFYFNAANDHREWGYERDFPYNPIITPLARGAVSIQAKIKVSANTFFVDSNDLLVMTVSEVEPY